MESCTCRLVVEDPPPPLLAPHWLTPPAWHDDVMVGALGLYADEAYLFKNHAVFSFKGKKPYFEQLLGSRPPSGVKTLLGPPDQNPRSAPAADRVRLFDRRDGPTENPRR